MEEPDAALLYVHIHMHRVYISLEEEWISFSYKKHLVEKEWLFRGICGRRLYEDYVRKENSHLHE